MEEEKPKIQLSSEQFANALLTGKAIDTNNVEHNFQSDKPIPGIYDIRNVDVRDAKLYNIKTDKIIFLTDCNFGDIIFLSCEFSNVLGIHGCTFEHYFAITRSILNHLDFNGNTFHSFFSTFSTVESLNLNLCTIEEAFSIYGNCSVNILNISKCNLSDKLELSDAFNNCKIDECQFTTFQIPAIKEKAIFKILNTKFNHIKTNYDFTNLGYMQWNNLKPLEEARIEISNAIMGKWDIVNCDFSETKMNIYSSKITDLFYTNTKFPKNLKPPSNIGEMESEHDILRDGYNQLKTLAQKQNDRRMFLHYQAAELKSYFKTLNWFWNFRTKFQLGAMRISNDYGTSWGLGFLFVIIANSIFVSAAYYDRSLLPNRDGLGNYFSGYLSSIFSLISVPTYFKGSWEVNWFYFSRLFVAFGIYQTIAAFRKFGKSE